MKELIVWLVHTPAGIIGLVAAGVALSTEKGSATHKKAGVVFTASMLVMLISGFVTALLIKYVDDAFLSAVVSYTVFTAWLTAHRKKAETGLLEYVALGWIILVGLAAFIININWREGGFPNIYLFWVSFAVICVIGDIRNLRRMDLTGVQRILRHVWRMCFSLLWAALALTDKIVKMLGSNVEELPEQQLAFVSAAPVMFILAITVYWITKILFSSRSKFAGLGG